MIDQISFTSADGTRLHGTAFRAARPLAGVLVVHGLQSHAGWVEAAGTGEYLAQRDILTLAFDRRGSGRSDGERGSVNRPQNFLEDLAAARERLRRELEASGAANAPIHVLANCFGTRIVLPYLLQNPGAFQSVSLTSPATHMTRQADYGPGKRLSILLSPSRRRFDTPLADSDFVRGGDWLEWIQSDALSLRSCTASFLRAAGRLTARMNQAVSEITTPLLIMTADDDVLVHNEAIVNSFRSQYRGPLRIEQLPGDHYMDFTAAQAEFRSVLAGWILGGWSTARGPAEAAR